MNALLTEQQVLAKMQRDDTFTVNLLLALYGQQEVDEQVTQATRHENGRGFNGCDAPILSSFAEQAKQTRAARKAGTCNYITDLSVKQLALLRKKLVKYGRQLTSLTNAALEAKVATLPPQAQEVHITIDSPYGTCPPTQHHALPAHLLEKVIDRNRLREAETQPNPLMPGRAPLPTTVTSEDQSAHGCAADISFSTSLVPCDGGFRFKTAKEYWVDGGKDAFNDKVTQWITERNGEGELVSVGGGPRDDDNDPFNF